MAEQQRVDVEGRQLLRRQVGRGHIGRELRIRSNHSATFTVQGVAGHQEPAYRVDHRDVPRRVPGRGDNVQAEDLIAVAHGRSGREDRILGMSSAPA